MAMERPKRLTVGVLAGYQIYEGSHPNPYAFPVIRGMQSAARQKNVNLLAACGVAREVGFGYRPAWPEVSEDMDFVPIGSWNTDGLIVLGPLRYKHKIEYARNLVDGGFPLIFIGTDAGNPTVSVDNEGGIRQVMEHLIYHHHHDIAFIAGDENDIGDSTYRLVAYQQGVQEFDLNNDPRLLEYGQHTISGGYQAMRRILQSGVKFTAVMCSNDQSALGAMKALREAGRQPPLDVAITGFDDILDCLAQFPPLTSVHYPLFETGYRALLLMLKRIEQGPGALPDVTRVSTSLVLRQSCGCLPQIAGEAQPGTEFSDTAGIASPQNIREKLAQAMQELFMEESSQNNSSEIALLCGRLVDSLMMSLEGGNQVHFQNAMLEILRHEEMKADDNTHAWQSAVSVLRRGVLAMLKGNRDSLRIERAEDLLHQARTMLSDSTQRRYTRFQIIQTNHDETMGLLTSRLISSSDEDQVYSVLKEDLPRVGVRECSVFFFEPQGKDPFATSRLRPLEKDAPALRFVSRTFPPPDLYPEDKPLNLALLPLIFQNEKLGYVAFDGVNLDPLATLVRQLSSSIKNVQLHAKVMDLSLTDGLTGVHNRRYFEILLEKETERSQRYTRDLAVIMIDVDYFKEYNDTFGHPAGDEALRQVVQCILNGARRDLDVVTRYGGDEFTVILPETDFEGARVVAEQILNKVRANDRFLRPQTVSIGFASLRGDKAHTSTLVNQADRALYQAKSQGRNRVVAFEDWMIDPAHPSKTGG